MNSYEYIAKNLEILEDEISNTCIKYNRRREDVLLLPVSKMQSIEKIRYVHELGYNVFGENRVQELTEKLEFLPEDICWHLIGSLQTNKVKYVIDKVKLIHSVDRISLLDEIEKRADKKGMKADCLLQINVSGEESKSGISIEKIDEMLSKSQIYKNIRIVGLMAIASFTDNKDIIRAEFESIRRKFVDIGSKKMHNIDMKYLSMGMSNDFKEAIEFGSNILRIGSTIFGPRV